MESTIKKLNDVVIKIAGDSGDGIQVAGFQFTLNTALAGNDVGIFPDYPAEIRAPQGTVAGVSGFQIHFGSEQILTPGDSFDVLVALNAAALKGNIASVKPGGILIVDKGGFDTKNIRLAGYKEGEDPLADEFVGDFKVIPIEVTRLNREALKELKMGGKDQDRSRNFFILGFLFWMFNRELKSTEDAIENLFAKKPEAKEPNLRALKAGYNLGDTMEVSFERMYVEPANMVPGLYRGVTGNKAMALGLIAASLQSELKLFLGTYPITPASDILHELSKYKHYGVVTFQAEDEIAAISACIGASFGGSLAVTSTSGPGFSLKQEALGLAVMMELPLVVIDVQRGGPSTGLPTKTEQADLLMAMFGRHGECPVAILAPRSPADCFEVAYEACRIAVTHMTPVILLSDGYIANGAESWLIPDPDKLLPIDVKFADESDLPYQPYKRDENLVRKWALPGMEGFEHRVGGLEKKDITGEVSYDAKNHEKMVGIRAEKIERISGFVPKQEIDSGRSLSEVEGNGKLLIVGWGSTWGTIHVAVNELIEEGLDISYAHLRYLNPFPSNLGEILSRFDKIVVPELNRGQLENLLRDRFEIHATGINKVQGTLFTVKELKDKIRLKYETFFEKGNGKK